MTVKELIDLLNTFDPTLPVITHDHEWGPFDVTPPKEVSDVDVNHAFGEPRKLYPKAVIM